MCHFETNEGETNEGETILFMQQKIFSIWWKAFLDGFRSKSLKEDHTYKQKGGMVWRSAYSQTDIALWR